MSKRTPQEEWDRNNKILKVLFIIAGILVGFQIILQILITIQGG